MSLDDDGKAAKILSFFYVRRRLQQGVLISRGGSIGRATLGRCLVHSALLVSPGQYTDSFQYTDC